ncbi:MAG TPA: hypothetical protein VKV24_20020 [Casimicrobiaceae bacterium]|nr:hypothetical protein [Casimicrobiaceae bacterium]
MRRPLPPYGREILEMLRRGLRPAIPDGTIVVSLDWNLGTAWGRIVLPKDHDPRGYYLDFLAGLDVLIVYRRGHPAEHVAAAIEAVNAARPHVCAECELPHLVRQE